MALAAGRQNALARTAWSLAAVTLLSAVATASPQDVPIETLRERLAAYIESFESRLSAVVSEEHYQQNVLGRTAGPARRVLKADFLLTRVPGAGGGGPEWVSFRDVFEVDGEVVQDRSDRLVRLFVNPTGTATDQIRSIINASASHNLGTVHRTINVPTLVLHFAKQSMQWRSEFRRGGRSRIDGHEVREVRFTERQLPRVIHTADNAPARGTFWIDEGTGRVHRTDLRIQTGRTVADIRVEYGFDPRLDMWLPVRMTERYATPGQSTITGDATYGNFRAFTVTVDSAIKR